MSFLPEDRRPLLSICIPTYNRAGRLKTQLAHLGELLSRTGNVAVTIIDNCSTDNTCQIAREFCEKYPNCLVYTNPTNIGLAGNLRRAVEVGCGSYVWILSDDDPVDSEAVRLSLRRLEAHQPKPSLVLFNSLKPDGSRYLGSISDQQTDESGSFFARIQRDEPVLTFWISGFWISRAIGEKTLALKLDSRNLMLPLALFALGSAQAPVIMDLPIVTHRHVVRIRGITLASASSGVTKSRCFTHFALSRN
jgi:glycosyltransferase involved in cell wall biosynthesis